MSYAEVVNNLELAIRRYKDATHHVSCIVDINILKEALDTIKEQKAEIERLQKNIDGLNIFTTNHIKVVRLQAIKEFAEKLKEKATSTFYEEHKYVDTEDIDNLIKEMTEAN